MSCRVHGKRRGTKLVTDDGARPGLAEEEDVGRFWVHFEDKTSIICHQIRCGRGLARGGGCWERSQLFCALTQAGRIGGKWLGTPDRSTGQEPTGRSRAP